MNKLSKKSFLLFMSALAVAAFAMPSLASAATFDGVGDHVLSSPDLNFTTNILGGSGSTCTTNDFTVNVPAGGASATVTSATFGGCVGTGAAAGLPVHVTATNFPWQITTLGVPGQIRIDGIHVTVNITGVGHVTLEGSLPGSYNNTTHTASFINAEGLTATSSLGNSAATVNGVFTDNSHSLTIT